jgi:hypothetical protein
MEIGGAIYSRQTGHSRSSRRSRKFGSRRDFLDDPLSDGVFLDDPLSDCDFLDDPLSEWDFLDDLLSDLGLKKIQ